jgi:hypothetical protein
VKFLGPIPLGAFAYIAVVATALAITAYII